MSWGGTGLSKAINPARHRRLQLPDRQESVKKKGPRSQDLDGVRVCRYLPVAPQELRLADRGVFSFMATRSWCRFVRAVDLVMGTSPSLFQAYRLDGLAAAAARSCWKFAILAGVLIDMGGVEPHVDSSRGG
jgi:hypothetical protein